MTNKKLLKTNFIRISKEKQLILLTIYCSKTLLKDNLTTNCNKDVIITYN